MIYYVRHETHYTYDYPVNESRQLLRLTPRTLPWQNLLANRITLNIEADQRNLFADAFGNSVEALHFETEHESLSVCAENWVSLQPPPPVGVEASPAWETVREQFAYHGPQILSADRLEASGFLFESRFVRIKRDFAWYAQTCFTPGRPLLAATEALMQTIFKEFRFDANATDISTPVTEVFEKRSGVCQDFAHFMISCLRSLGLAARYVSGYILTHPAAGKTRMVGADATHAWVSVYCPHNGWVDFDPTNAIRPRLEHITLGWGRDFADVSPLRGVILGGGEHDLKIAVTMAPESEFMQLFGPDKTSAPVLALPAL